jgi:hypothetical protein
MQDGSATSQINQAFIICGARLFLFVAGIIIGKGLDLTAGGVLIAFCQLATRNTNAWPDTCLTDKDILGLCWTDQARTQQQAFAS